MERIENLYKKLQLTPDDMYWLLLCIDNYISEPSMHNLETLAKFISSSDCLKFPMEKCSKIVKEGLKAKSKEYIIANLLLYKWKLKQKREFSKLTKEREAIIKSKYHIYKDIVLNSRHISITRETGNDNTNTFDFVTVNIFKGNITKEYLETHIDEFVECIFAKLDNLQRYKKYGVPTSYLKLDEVKIIGYDIFFYFSLKEV